MTVSQGALNRFTENAIEKYVEVDEKNIEELIDY